MNTNKVQFDLGGVSLPLLTFTAASCGKTMPTCRDKKTAPRRRKSNFILGSLLDPTLIGRHLRTRPSEITGDEVALVEESMTPSGSPQNI